MDFASSGYARDFFQGQVPQIIRSLKSIANSQQKLVELQMQNSTSSSSAVSTVAKDVGVVYVCYEENCADLFDEAGAVNHMFVTVDADQVLSWAKRSLSRAEENNYLPVDEGELKQFLDAQVRSNMPAFGFTKTRTSLRNRAMVSALTDLIWPSQMIY